jgi:hypothetical protein
MLTPKEQVQLHENLALKENNLHIINLAPSSLDSKLVGRMISISFKHNYTVILPEKTSPEVSIPATAMSSQRAPRELPESSQRAPRELPESSYFASKLFQIGINC